jgi:hypothetical protein
MLFFSSSFAIAFAINLAAVLNAQSVTTTTSDNSTTVVQQQPIDKPGLQYKDDNKTLNQSNLTIHHNSWFT